MHATITKFGPFLLCDQFCCKALFVIFYHVQEISNFHAMKLNKREEIIKRNRRDGEK